MIAPFGIPLSPVIGGGDCRTLLAATMLLRSSDVASGDGWFARGCVTDGVRRCFVKYDVERGKTGLELVLWG